MISYGRQSIDQTDIDAVIAVLQSDWLTQGPCIEAFEKKVATYCGAKYAVAVANATSALHIACLASGLKKGDALWTSPNTFVASANCARYCGACVDFVEIDNQTYNMSMDALEQKLESGAPHPNVIMPVHFSGQPCDMERLANLQKKYGFTVIEDASHAIGAEYRGTRIGAGDYSDMTVFSFHPVKIVTTAEGGMVLTNRRDLYEKLCLYRSHGITRDSAAMDCPTEEPWYYEQIDLGFNYRMTDLQAALGISQMKRLNAFLARRRQLARQYDEALSQIRLQLPMHSAEFASSWHLYVVRADFQKLSFDKKSLFAKLAEQGIRLNLHYIPVHLQPYYRKLGFKEGDYPVCEKYYQEAFTLPLYYGLTDVQQTQIVQALQEVFADAE